MLSACMLSRGQLAPVVRGRMHGNENVPGHFLLSMTRTSITSLILLNPHDATYSLQKYTSSIVWLTSRGTGSPSIEMPKMAEMVCILASGAETLRIPPICYPVLSPKTL